MKPPTHTLLQIREVFHLEFLRWFATKLQAEHYALKGGVNLRFFFNSVRYSEDMDIDIRRAGVQRVQRNVMDILESKGFLDGLKSYGIDRVVPPDMTKAKQTQTTQRFKIHLLTSAGEDLFTKIEFSRRERPGRSVVESVSNQILRSYKTSPFLVPHYGAASAVEQKIQALAHRTVLQARDIFDLFVLDGQCDASERESIEVDRKILKTAYDNIFLVDFDQFRDTVVAYLGAGDQMAYATYAAWDDIKLRTARLIEELRA